MAILPISSRTLMLFACFVCLLSLLIPHGNSVSFNFNFTDPNPVKNNITLQPDSFYNNVDRISLTRDGNGQNLASSIGRATYNQPVLFWNKKNEEANFTTQFSFLIQNVSRFSGDGFTFFLAPYPAMIPSNASNTFGKYLGLFENTTAMNASMNQILAVEFDTYPNDIDPYTSGCHVGIDINTIISTSYMYMGDCLFVGSRMTAQIDYNSGLKLLSVLLWRDTNPNTKYKLNATVDISKVLPNMSAVGFSAATGSSFEIHQIFSWSFRSTLEVEVNQNSSSLPPGSSPMSTPPLPPGINIGLIIGIIAGVVLMLIILILVVLYCKLKKSNSKTIATEIPLGRLNSNTGVTEETHGPSTEHVFTRVTEETHGPSTENVFTRVTEETHGPSTEHVFEKGRGPKKFTYSKLVDATNSFAKENKLGEGGFGPVYRGILKHENIPVAVKRVSKMSKQVKKAYKAEVKIISQVRHRNLVKLVGWCHDHGELLLVYELMCNKSLDIHLYHKECPLTWPIRQNIAVRIGSAILYLHEECEQCVVHRDIKPSNILLDYFFNAKLGDFGLARLTDHHQDLNTTTVAGTQGYMPPECTHENASTYTDVFSFGVVLLEIVCGRRPIVPQQDRKKVSLVEWVWDLYGQNALLEAVDSRLNGEFKRQEVECFMIVGLWCANPDKSLRPSIRKAISVLQFHAPLPDLPRKIPRVPGYAAPIDPNTLLNASSSVAISGIAVPAPIESTSSWLLKQQANTI